MKSETRKSETVKYDKKGGIEDMEETIQMILLDAGKQKLGMGIKVVNERIAREVPEGWKNAGTEERWLVSSIGTLRY